MTFCARRFGFPLAVGLLAAIGGPLVARGASPIEFNRDVRPILADKCFACHGPDSASREADLRLDLEEQAKADRGGYAAVVPKNIDESALVQRITSEEESERMPPHETGKPLSTKEIELLKQWVAEGASWQLAWAYVPPKRVAAPVVSDTSWPVNWIDYFVHARLEAEGLKPATDADKTTLIRRLSIDLTGLPPASSEVDDFLADERPEAYERLVDRLLASPHYGERMAMYWLDLVRFANTVGYHGDQEHQISPYRDYVINSLNANMPFDQFTREQLGGDLLPAPTIEQKVATGYNRLLQTSHEGGVQPKEYMAIYSADHVRNVSAVWMGGTVGCAQCHDHKFDPYTARDFYSLAAFFADVDENQHLQKGADVSPTLRVPEMDVRGRATMITVAIEPREIRILPRGNWLDDSGDSVQPAIPEFLGKLETQDRRATRLDLANWLTDAERGSGDLTARVMANRFWYLCFGRGIAGTLDDFGGQGEAPSHPALLDALAVEFVESGWDVKQMMKLIVMSRAYRQSSMAAPELIERDPLNQLVARQAQFRYPAESVRDAALAIGGLLVRTVGGDSVRPYQPADYYKHLNFPERAYEPSTDEGQWRRGVYMHWQRQYLHPMLKALDAPSREECTVQRPRSNTSLAALALLNDPSFAEAARAFAGRILEEGGATTADRLNFALREATSRPADAEEQQVLGDLLAQSLGYYQENPEAADKLLGIGLAPRPENLNPVELASWMIVARTVLNLNEVITRN
ncbi:MAG: PSD1 and planctomycete cytochrome C domain-containing protein [Pirellulales bacterium]